MAQLINIKQFKEAVFNLHDVEVNQKYNGYPFSLHLKAVLANCSRFRHLLKQDTQTYHLVLAGCLLHDSIEDARLTYNDVKAFVKPYVHSTVGLTVDEFCTYVAEIVILLTEYSRGRTREERHPDSYFTDLRGENLARYVKLCDIGANRMYSLFMNQHDMYMKYVNEFPRVKELTMVEHSLGDPFQEIYDYIDGI